MTVRGRLIGGAPFFRAWVRSDGFQGALLLLADTGAARTTILDFDAKLLGVPYGDLPAAPRPMAGIGGVVRSFVARDVEVRIGFPGPVLVLRQDLYVTRHDIQGLAPAEMLRIMILPSIMGRDIIDRFRFVYEHATGTVLLER